MGFPCPCKSVEVFLLQSIHLYIPLRQATRMCFVYIAVFHTFSHFYFLALLLLPTFTSLPSLPPSPSATLPPALPSFPPLLEVSRTSSTIFLQFTSTFYSNSRVRAGRLRGAPAIRSSFPPLQPCISTLRQPPLCFFFPTKTSKFTGEIALGVFWA